mmetsp:Transcript_28193/g.81680  ORF Transcript_28193/g.81680 Transcript_28193/m.81680 type:complete len:309 (-) Transcript_28193:2131-3057(-)
MALPVRVRQTGWVWRLLVAQMAQPEGVGALLSGDDGLLVRPIAGFEHRLPDGLRAVVESVGQEGATPLIECGQLVPELTSLLLAIGLLPPGVWCELRVHVLEEVGGDGPSEMVDKLHVAVVVRQTPSIVVAAQVHGLMPRCVAPGLAVQHAIANDVAGAALHMVLHEHRPAGHRLPLRPLLIRHPVGPLLADIRDAHPLSTCCLMAQLGEVVADEPRLVDHPGLSQRAGDLLHDEHRPERSVQRHAVDGHDALSHLNAVRARREPPLAERHMHSDAAGPRGAVGVPDGRGGHTFHRGSLDLAPVEVER